MKTIVAAIVVLLSFFLMSCKKDIPVPPGGNLINNPAFDSAGYPSLQGWTGIGYSFVNDVPPNGGPWSLQLEPQWMSEGYAETYITGLNGNYNFHFSCYTKVLRDGIGTVTLRLKKQNNTLTDLATDSITNADWAQAYLDINVSLQPTDQLIVHLSAGRTEVANWQVLFNNVYLQKK